MSAPVTDLRVTVVAQALYEFEPWQTGPAFDRRDLTWAEMVEEDEVEPYLMRAARVVTALDEVTS